MLPDALLMAAHFTRTRWLLNFHDRYRLEAWQQQRLQYFIRHVLPRAPYYRHRKIKALSDLPSMDKADLMAEFEVRNTRGISLDQALAIGLHAEKTRNFLPLLGDITVGLSSGTSGNQAVFLANPAERLRWAGILLARALPGHLIQQLLTPWKPPLRIAFFLRANSNLYTTLNSRRIDFEFHDLLAGVDAAVPQLNRSQPDILVGPPALLRALAAQADACSLSIAPAHIISVADVLEDNDRNIIQAAFNAPLHQLYQATEGFLGYTCEQGKLHLNESFVHIEPQWLDAGHTRFQPIVTDFTRETQLIVRYRLNDVLRVAEQACPCGRAERTLAAIEGRADEIILLPEQGSNKPVTVYPDLIRRTMMFAGSAVREYNLRQEGMRMTVGLLAAGDRAQAIRHIRAEFDALWQQLHIVPPEMVFTDWQAPLPGSKRRRIHRQSAPEGLPCTF